MEENVMWRRWESKALPTRPENQTAPDVALSPEEGSYAQLVAEGPISAPQRSNVTDAKASGVIPSALLERLVDAEEASILIGGVLSEWRLKNLALDWEVPCWKIDERFFFDPDELTKWVLLRAQRREPGLQPQPRIHVDPVTAANAPVGIPRELEVIAPHLKGMRPTVESGVYFLMRAGELDYIGKSANVHSRVRTHDRGRQSEALYVPLPESEITEVEAAFIRHFRPPGNNLVPAGNPSKDTEILARFGLPLYLGRALDRQEVGR